MALPAVRCDSCGNLTTSGLHQKRLKLIRKAFLKKIDGRWKRIPPVMKEEDAYMCTGCVKRGKKWPGQKPT